MNYFLTEEAIEDLQNGVRWYNNKQSGLGKKFYNYTIREIKAISKRPLSVAVRYDDVHCFPLKTYPYMIHFLIYEKTVIILGVINTSLNPETNWHLAG